VSTEAVKWLEEQFEKGEPPEPPVEWEDTIPFRAVLASRVHERIVMEKLGPGWENPARWPEPFVHLDLDREGAF